MNVEKFWDDLWIGVKGQSNLDILVLREIYLGRASDEFLRG